MGHGFGELEKVRGVIYFKMSPYELKPFKGLLTHSPLNFLKRIRGSIFIVGTPLLASYALYDWAENEFIRVNRKNPKDFENDV